MKKNPSVRAGVGWIFFWNYEIYATNALLQCLIRKVLHFTVNFFSVQYIFRLMFLSALIHDDVSSGKKSFNSNGLGLKYEMHQCLISNIYCT